MIEAIEHYIGVFVGLSVLLGFFSSIIYKVLKDKFVHKPPEGTEFQLKPKDERFITMSELSSHCKSSQAVCASNFCRKIEELKTGQQENRKIVIRSYTDLARKFETAVKDLYDENKDDRKDMSEKMELMHNQLGHLAGVIEGRGNLAEIVKK